MSTRPSGYAKQPDQWYQEPRCAIDALLNVESFAGPGIVWDPCCGAGNIPDACLARGLAVSGSDIVDRGYRHHHTLDFLTSSARVDHIVCNPPFDLAVEFVLHGLKLVTGKVAIIQRTTWLEGDRRYNRLFRLGHLARVWQFRKRLSMPPGGCGIEPKNGSIAFAWFVFEVSHNGPWTGGWLP